MAFALVGSAGAASQGAASAAVTPAWGAGAGRSAGDLLLLFCTVTGSATLPGTPAGWSIGRQVAGTSCSATVYFKVAAGSDAAPTVAAITSGLIAAHLEEWSGGAAVPLDRAGSQVGTSSPVTATLAAANVAVGELVAMAGADRRSTARLSADTWTSNHGTPTLQASNNASSSTDHYSHATLLSNSVAAADTAVMTLSLTTSITGLAVAACSFLLLPVAQALTGVGGLSVGGGADASNAAVLADSPVAFWRLGEASGSPQDSAGTNHVTSVNGTPTYGVAGVPTSGDTAVSFNGTTDYFAAPSVAALDTGDVVTLEAWVAPGVVTQNRGIASRGTNGYYLRLVAGGQIQFLKSQVAVICSSTSNVPTTGLHHVAVVKNGSTVNLYLDGVDVTGSVSNATLGVSTQRFTIGADWNGGSELFSGTIAKVAVYATPLSAARVAAHYNAGVTPSSLVFAPTAVQVIASQALAAGLVDAGASLSAPAAVYVPRLLPGLLDAGAVLYAGTVVRGAAPVQSVTAAFIDAGATVVGPSITLRSTASVGFLDSGSSVFGPVLVSQSSMAVAYLASSAAVFAPVASSAAYVFGVSFLDAGAGVYAPVAVAGSGAQVVVVPSLDSLPFLFGPVLVAVPLVQSLVAPWLFTGSDVFPPDVTGGGIDAANALANAINMQVFFPTKVTVKEARPIRSRNT